MKRILVASDLSQRSRRALGRAVALARQFGCEMVALHVADDDRPGEMIAAERRRAEAAIRDDLHAAGVEQLASEPVIVTRAGDPFKIIAEEADRVGAELIVLGAHRKSLLGDVFTGTTIERVMRLGSRPVLMVNNQSETPYRRILAAVDSSDASAHALRTARSLGLLDAEHAAIIHGFMPLGESSLHYANIDRRSIDEYVEVNAAKARDAIAAFLRENGLSELDDMILVEKGDPYDAILKGVSTMRPDLLVIGTRGHTGFRRILLGSVADQVLRQIEVDVLAVPPGRTPSSC